MKKRLTVILMILQTFCLSGQLMAQKIKTVDGVEVVENPEKPNTPKGIPTRLILEEDFKIGDSEVEEEMIAQVTFFVVDEKESIYALDSKAYNIKVFDNKGAFVRSIAKQGQGPGEINLASGLLITPDNELIVEDVLNRRLAYFTLEGVFLRNVSIADKTSLTNLVMDNAGNYLGRQFVIEDKEMFFEVRKFDKDLNSLFTIEKTPFNMRDPLKDKFKIFDFAQIYFFDPEGQIYYGNPKEYEIQILSSEGKLKKKITKKYKPEKMTEEDKEKILDRFPDTGFSIRERIEFPKEFPAYETFTLDEEGRLIVRTYNKAEEEDNVYLDVFDAEGKYIACFPSKANPRLWKNGKMYAIEETDEGFTVIKRYTVSWQ